MTEAPKITRDQVNYLASLARLELSVSELDAFAQQIEKILSTVRVVDELVDFSAIGEVAQLEPWLFGAVNVYRPDEPIPSLTTADSLAAAPAALDDKFVVPRILGEES